MVFPQPLAAVGETENVREDILLYLGSLFSTAVSLAVETVCSDTHKTRTLNKCILTCCT